MQATAAISKALTIPGWMSEEELLWLADMAGNCYHIVEFGSYYGRSTRALADNIQRTGRLWAVDPWAGNYPDKNGDPMENVNTYVYPDFCRNLQDHISEGRVIPHRGYSYSFSLPYHVDMVFIDGDHRYETVLKDIDTALKLLAPGGIISGHDYNWDSVKQAVHEKLGDVFSKETIWWKTKY